MRAMNLEEKLRSVLNQIFRRQAQELLAKLPSANIDANDIPSMARWNEAMLGAVKPIMAQIWQQGTETGYRRLAGASKRKGVMAQRNKAGTKVILKAGQKIILSTNVSNPKVLDAIDSTAMAFCQETNATATLKLEEAIAELREQLKQGIPQGEAHRTLQTRILQIFADPARARAIATTETSRALNAAEIFSYQQSGVVGKKRWEASADACPLCLALDMKEVDLDEPFYVDPKGGPYAVVMHPPLHPNCFCVTVPVLGKPKPYNPPANAPAEDKLPAPQYTLPAIVPQSMIPGLRKQPDEKKVVALIPQVQEDMASTYGYPPAPVNSFGYYAAAQSVAAVLRNLPANPASIDVDGLAENVHGGWAYAARNYPNQPPEKKQERLVLAATPFKDLTKPEQDKDRTVVRSVLRQVLPEYWGTPVQPYYRPGPNYTVDNVITRDGPFGLEVLLIRRKVGTTEGGKWALPGGFHDTAAPKGSPWKAGMESARSAALRELVEETGLNASKLRNRVKPIGTYGQWGRDPRDNDESWSVSQAFRLHLNSKLASASIAGQDDAEEARWFPISELPDLMLAFDHRKIIADAKLV